MPAVRSARLRSLAKINLDLRVLHKNPDGFHDMRTVFQTISLADVIDIEFEPAKRTSINIDDPLSIGDNLIVRAAQRVLDALKLKARVHFRLTKKIPMGGGLGGGSSNAAAVLLALPVLAGRCLPVEKLLELGAGLGSDVPFFLLGGAAVGVGRGTELHPLPDLAEEPLLLAASGIHVSTPDAYKALKRGLTFPRLSPIINSFQAAVWALQQARSAAAASPFCANDFEASVFRRHPQLHTIRAKLSGVAVGARMSGSGSAIFALFRSAKERDLAEKLLLGDPVFEGCRLMRCALVSRKNYQRLWRRRLRQHLAPVINLSVESWPPQSRYRKNE
ncbi:MAG: 4-(cytidine 5'-diphospho)-2-C-methyl-D-erythritol kinase [Bryobacterales bacterium]|nr:4-(cytidine 5'-diphospho)-2-C-methyl-D-erythritol kinase [Bryobacterales bacterium]MBV9397870.1 4-(cytidine 5'-diphospho)-2-C-methyl-D-erythritol kinase [Bryobacterales bacterium]